MPYSVAKKYHIIPFFYPEDGGSSSSDTLLSFHTPLPEESDKRFLQHGGTFLPHYMASHPRRE
jgi:hypothetical protein